MIFGRRLSLEACVLVLFPYECKFIALNHHSSHQYNADIYSILKKGKIQDLQCKNRELLKVHFCKSNLNFFWYIHGQKVDEVPTSMQRCCNY